MFELPKLPYDYKALEATIDAKTMEIHHTKHHNAYVTNLNNALQAAGGTLGTWTIEKLCQNLKEVPEAQRTAVRNNGGGHFNHTLFWTVMGPKCGGKPTGTLATTIDKTFGSFDTFKQQFTTAAMTRFGSGWAWLGVKNDKTLCVCSTPNQDNPLMTGFVDCTCTPILGLDVWEHAYYLNYQNRRPDYITAWWNVVNWNEVANRYTTAIK